MIEINGHLLMEDEQTIVVELKQQLILQGRDVFHKFVSTPGNLMTTCPFHKDGQERKPSFGILTKKRGKQKSGTSHCFACGWTGSFEEMVSNCFGYDDMGNFGTKWLAKNFQSVSIESRTLIEIEPRDKPKQIQEYISDADYDKYRVYHSYMWKRKMTPETVDLFDIGYDAVTACITFPIKDANGNILFIAKRSVKTKFFNYPSEVEKPVYGLYEMKLFYQNHREYGPIEEVIICESMINAITCYAYGRYAVALNGTGTPFQYEQLKKLPIRHFILALDPDEAGDKGKIRLKNALTNKILTEYIIPVGKDINDLTREEFNSLLERMV